MNLYGYAHSDPVNFVDVTGKSLVVLAGAGAGAVLGAYSNKNGSFGQVLKGAFVGGIYGGLSPGSIVVKFAAGAIGDASGQYVENGGNNHCINFGQVLAAGVLGTIVPAALDRNGLASNTEIGQTGIDLVVGAMTGPIPSAVGDRF